MHPSIDEVHRLYCSRIVPTVFCLSGVQDGAKGLSCCIFHGIIPVSVTRVRYKEVMVHERGFSLAACRGVGTECWSAMRVLEKGMVPRHCARSCNMPPSLSVHVTNKTHSLRLIQFCSCHATAPLFHRGHQDYLQHQIPSPSAHVREGALIVPPPSFRVPCPRLTVNAVKKYQTSTKRSCRRPG